MTVEKVIAAKDRTTAKVALFQEVTSLKVKETNKLIDTPDGKRLVPIGFPREGITACPQIDDPRPLIVDVSASRVR